MMVLSCLCDVSGLDPFSSNLSLSAQALRTLYLFFFFLLQLLDSFGSVILACSIQLCKGSWSGIL